MQFSIFHTIAENNIKGLVDALNDNLNPKEQYKLISIDTLPKELILLTVSNDKDFLLNIVDQNGIVPISNCVNWRKSSIIINEFGNKIPESLMRIRISEINKSLLDKGYDWDYIENFWNDILTKNKTCSLT